jgi:hypothetical protein
MFVIEKLEGELSGLQRRHEAAIQDIARLESRLQTNNMEAQSESDLLKDEVIYFTILI